MSRKTIAKLSGFVIFLAAAVGGLAACSGVSSSTRSDVARQDYEKPKNVGRFANRAVKESSGVAASPCQNGVYWTHNDSGGGPFIFAADRSGKDLGTWRVSGARNIDWEDITALKDGDGKCSLFIGEIGNNQLERTEAIIYRIAEPLVGGGTGKEGETEPAAVLRFRYPDKPHNAETLMVNPLNGDLYVLTKLTTGPSTVFRLKPNFNATEPVVAEKVGEMSVPSIPNGLLTGGSISPDGKRVALCDYTNGYELVMPEGDAQFDDIWKQKPAVVDLGERKQGEAVTYTADGRSIIATSEGKNGVIVEVNRRN